MKQEKIDLDNSAEKIKISDKLSSDLNEIK